MNKIPNKEPFLICNLFTDLEILTNREFGKIEMSLNFNKPSAQAEGADPSGCNSTTR